MENIVKKVLFKEINSSSTVPVKLIQLQIKISMVRAFDNPFFT